MVVAAAGPHPMPPHRASRRACPDEPICTHEMGQYLGPLVLADSARANTAHNGTRPNAAPSRFFTQTSPVQPDTGHPQIAGREFLAEHPRSAGNWALIPMKFGSK